jgi:hypothetical protein
MDAKLAMALLCSAALIGLSGCSTPELVVEPAATITRLPQPAEPVPRYELRDGRWVPVPELQSGRTCQLGTSCLAMDPRPFEPCLLSTKHCSDKIEPILVGPPPELIIPAPQVEVGNGDSSHEN